MPSNPIPSTAVSLALVLLAAAPDSGWSQESASPVVVAPVVQQPVRTGHRVVGTVTAARTSIVGSAVDGRVEEYLVQAGDQVYAGQPLARLRTGTLEIELAAARAELAVRDAELAELEAGSRPQEIDEARANAERSRIVYENAGRKLQRAESLLARGAVNQDEYDNLREAALAAGQTRRAAEAALSRIEAGPRAEVRDQARARRQLQQEQVRLIEDRLNKFQIVAPYDGFIAVESTQQGEWVQQGDPIAEVIQLNAVDVVANVPTEFAVQLMLGETVRVEFPQLPDQVLTGTVSRIVPNADVRTRTYPVHVRMANPIASGRPLLMAGMLARIDLPAGTLNEALLVPKDALVLNQGQRLVFVVDPSTEDPSQGSVRGVNVSLGVAVDNRVQVDGPLKPGELVVIRGNERLTNGQPVMVRERTSAELK